MNTEFALDYTFMETPVGRLLLAGDDEALHFLSFPGGHKAFGPHPRWRRRDDGFAETQAQLAAYFAGTRRVFDLPLTLHGTAFQQRVWQTLPDVPYGETRSYGWLAKTLDAPKAFRAVGAANGNNPLPIVLPCHRILGADGALTGFGGGIETKRFLLDLETRAAA